MTEGVFFTDIDEGLVSLLEPHCGFEDGVVRLLVDSGLLGSAPEFTHAFELFEYGGQLRCSRSERGDGNDSARSNLKPFRNPDRFHRAYKGRQ